MSLTAKESPKWEPKPATKPRTGVREYGIEVSAETFRKLLWVVRGVNATDRDNPERLTVSSVAETALREWLADQWPELDSFWQAYEDAEKDAERLVAQKKGKP